MGLKHYVTITLGKEMLFGLKTMNHNKDQIRSVTN